MSNMNTTKHNTKFISLHTMYTRPTYEARPSPGTFTTTKFKSSSLKDVFLDQRILLEIPCWELHICLPGDVPEVTDVLVAQLTRRCDFATLDFNYLSLFKRKVISVPIGYWKKLISSAGAVACLQCNVIHMNYVQSPEPNRKVGLVRPVMKLLGVK